MAHRDRISQLPEELLLRILSLLPAKDVVVTMVLSKRWKFLWMLVPRLEYDHALCQDCEDSRFSRFVYGSLLLHEAPILECLRLKLGRMSRAVDIGVWVKTAVKRCVRELDIDIDSPSILSPVGVPWSLFVGGCSVLVTLKLSNMTLVDASSSPASFPFLKSLSLVKMKYPSEEFIYGFLCSCPVLENLVVERCPNDNVFVLAVQIPSLKTLSVRKTTDIDGHEAAGFLIDAPLLKSFDIVDHKDGGLCVIWNKMPEIVYAHLDINHSVLSQFMGSITSVKRLYLCLSTLKNAYPVGSVFHRLVHLTLCTCKIKWLKRLMCLLRDSPRLQILRLEQCHGIGDEEPRPCWNEPSSVPECVSSSLETLEWVKYEGTEEEKEVMAFIFRNARCLKKATISSTTKDPVNKLEMLKELSFLSRCSRTCHLAFD